MGKQPFSKLHIFIVIIAFPFHSIIAEFKVGVILPLSGPLAEYGEASRNGIELARREKSEQFKDILIHYEDSSYQATKAITALRR